jgi:membrane fusion protein, heavy metal efflux system
MSVQRDSRATVLCAARVAAIFLPLALTHTGCTSREKSGQKKAEAPATLQKPTQEENLAIVVLTTDAEKRLGIAFGEIERQEVPRMRTFGGDVVIPFGQSVIVSAPVAGTLAAPDGGSVPAPGTQVTAGNAVYRFLPLLSPDRTVPNQAELVQMANAQGSLVSQQITATGDVERGQAEVENARINFDRATKLLKDSVGSARDVDDTRARLQIAERMLVAAEARKEVLDQLTLDLKEGRTTTAIPITAPQSGVLRRLIAVAGQTVAAGEILFEIADLNRMWIRVPVYVGQQDKLDLAAGALVHGLTDSTKDSRPATPIDAPPSADALASTADLYFEIDNSKGELRPGERVGVTLQERGEATSLVAPEKAVLYDIYGGTWVYTHSTEHQYLRRRVVIRHTFDDPSKGRLAVLVSGPEVGTKVVTDGAAELFGTEFGAGK